MNDTSTGPTDTGPTDTGPTDTGPTDTGPTEKVGSEHDLDHSENTDRGQAIQINDNTIADRAPADDKG